MESDENQELKPSLSILQRMDGLDRLLLYLEEKHFLSARHPTVSTIGHVKSEDQCKSLSSALEEVHHKGTLMERMALLENRVSQLSLDIAVGDTSRSSFSTIPLPEKLGHGSGSSPKVQQHHDDVITTLQLKQDHHKTQTKREHGDLARECHCRSLFKKVIMLQDRQRRKEIV